MEINLFELASRLRIRFPSPKGDLVVEDLWDLPLTSTVANRPNLNDVAIAMHNQASAAAKEISFVETAKPKTPQERSSAIGLDIVKHIIAVKQAENNARALQQAKAARRQELMQLIAEAKQGELRSKSVTELEALLLAED